MMKTILQRNWISSLITAVVFLSSLMGIAQTDPAAFDLAGANYSFTGFAAGTTTTFPTNMAGHKFAAEPLSAVTGAPNADFALSASTAAIGTGSIRNEVANGVSILNSGSNNLGAIVVAVKSTGRNSLKVSFTAEQLNGPNAGGTGRANTLRLQYRVGTTGAFIDIASTDYVTTNTSTLNAATTFSNIAIPSGADNQSVVQLRWIYYTSSGTSGSRNRIRLDDITVSSTAAASSPTITGTATATAFTTTYGTASASQTFPVSGSNLTTNITATAPTGFEVASDGVTFGNTATITQSGGTASGNISVRLKANAVVGATYNAQNIALTSGTATTVNITTAASGNAVSPLGVTLSGVVVNNKTYNGNTTGSFDLTGASVSGTLFSDVVTINSTAATATFASANAGTGISVTAAGFALAGTNAGNYTLTAQPSGLTADITKANQTITFGALADKAATDPAFNLTGTASSGLTVTYISSNPAVATVSGNTVTLVGAGDTTITASQAGDSNYNAASDVAQNLHVTAIAKIDQTITFNALAPKLVNDTPFNLTATASSGLTVSYSSSNTAVATVSGNTVTIVGAGSTNITASQAGDTTYNAAPDVVQALSVSKLNQTITFGTLAAVTYGDASFVLSGSSDSGLTVSYLSSNPAVATVSGNTVTIVAPGTTNITASQAGNATYNVATDVPQGLTVNTKTLTVTGAVASNKVFNGNTAATITGATLVGVVSPDVVTVSGGGTFSSATVGTAKPVTAALTLGGADAAKYTLTQPTGLTADITPLVVNRLVISQVYGGGGNTSATYQNDFVELFNPTGAVINLNNYTVQYTSATGTGNWSSTGNLGNVNVQPGKYFLIKLASAAAIGATFTSDFTSPGINMSATAGKVALTNTTTLLSGGNPSSTAIVDLFGFGGTATAFEGSPATALSGNVNSYQRNSFGCVDTNNNNSDFTNSNIASVRSSATAANYCNPTIIGTATATAFTTTYGTPSTARTFAVSGGALTANITATAPTGFEVASDGVTYGPTATFTQTGGNASGTLSVRLAANASVTGTYNAQNIVLSSTGATSVNVTTAASGNTVTAAALTITGLTGSNKTYDRLTTASFTGTADYVGLQNGETFSVTGTPTASFASATVGNGKTISVTGYTAPSSNYTVTQPSLSGNITAQDVTITGVTANNKTYDGNNTATLNTGSAAVSGVIAPDDVTVNSGSATATFATANAGNGIAVTAFGFSLNGVDAGNYNLVSQPSGLTANITKAGQTITFGPLANKNDNDAAFALTATASSGLTVSYSSSDTNVATVAGNTVTIVGAGSTIITASQAGDSNYDAASDVAQTQLVNTTTKSDQVITFNALSNATYGDANFALTATSDSGLTVTYLSSNPAVATVSGNIVTVVAPGTTTITAQQAGNSAFNPAVDVLQSLTVNTKTLTVTGAVAASKEYDTTDAASISGATLVGIVGSDDVTVSGNGTFNNANAGTSKPVTAALTLGGADNAKYTLSQPSGLTADITAKAVTVSGVAASNKQYNGNTTATLTGTAVLSGVFPADASNVSFDFSSGTAAFATAAVGTGITVTATGYGLTGSAAGNYSLTQPTGLTADITVKTLTLTGFAFNSKTYDGNDTIAITGTPALSGVVGTEDVNLTGTLTASFPAANAGSNYSIAITGLSITGTDSGNYILDTTGFTASINAAVLTYVADAATRVYNTANPVFSGSVTGFVNSENIATATTGTLAFTTSATALSPVAAYSLNGSGLSATNYTFVQASGNATAFTITQATQTITFGTLANKTTADAPYALTGTASSGLTVSYSSSNPAVATVAGSTVTIVGAGTTTITASQAGNVNYSAATSVPQTLTVTAAAVSIVAWNTSTEIGGANFFGTSPFVPTTNAANVTNGSLIRGTGVATSNVPTANGASRGWGGIGWAANSAAAISGDKVLTFTTKANTDYTLSLTSLSPFSYRRSSTGPSSAELQYKIDAGAYTTITTFALTNTASSGATISNTDLTGITALQNVPSTSTITFRIVPYGASSTTGTFYIYDVANSTASDLSVNGIVTYAPTNQAPTATAVAVSGTPTIGQTLTGSYTYNDTEGDLESGSTYRWFRADDISGSNEGAILNATGISYQLTSTDLNKFVRFGVTPKAGTGTVTGVEAYSSPRLQVSPVGDAVSTITADPSFTESQNINYAAYTGTDVTASSIEIGRFLVNDVIGTPGDALTTKLTNLTLTLLTATDYEKIALYDDLNNEIAEIPAASTLNFPSLSIEAASGASKSFSVRATYKTTVVDNHQSVLVVTSAVSDSAGSIFAASNAGGAATAAAGDSNRIEVTATDLAYGQNASNAFINVAMTPAVTVKAVDANNNTDLDYLGQINVVSTGTMTPASATPAAGTGTATFSTLTHTAFGSGFQLTASSTGLNPKNSVVFDVFNPIFYNLIVDTNPSLANPYTNGQFVITNLTASGIGRGTGLTAASAANRYSATAWNTTALDANDYFEWTITPQGTNEIDLVNFIYTGQTSAQGPVNFILRSSVDNYTADINTNTVVPGIFGSLISLSAPEFQNITTPITFRLYGWGGTGGTFSVNDFNFDGEVTPSSATNLNVSLTALSSMDYIVGNGPSVSKSFTVTGGNLTPASGDITVSSDSADYELSADNVSFSAGPLLLPYTGNSLATTTVYTRLVAGLSAGSYAGELTISGGNATDKLVSLSGTVRTPLDLSYVNTFRTQALHNEAVTLGFGFNGVTFTASPPSSGYEQIVGNNSSVETPVIDFNASGVIQLTYTAATFNGSSGQTISVEVSTDGGLTYNPISGTTLSPTSTTYLTLTKDIDLAAYNTNNGRLRFKMTAGTNPTHGIRFRDLALRTITTWDGVSWTNGAPDINSIAAIEGNYTTATDGAISAKTLHVNFGQVVVSPNTSITLQDELTVEPIDTNVTFENNANLIQQNAVTPNSGNVTVKRSASMRRQDYVYWSSPVSGPQTLRQFSTATLATRFYELNEAGNNFAALNPLTTTFAPAKGYMIRAADTLTNNVVTWTGKFKGQPNNGTLTVQTTHDGQGYNMIGNPYPSPVNATAFLTANPTLGTLYFWTHKTQGAASGENYATFNGTGSASPSGSEAPNGFIQTGQGFVVQVATPTVVTFTNALRADNHSNQFFRNANNVSDSENGRIWLNLKNAEGNTLNQMLLGYVAGATNDVDLAFDGKAIEASSSAVYNQLDNAAYTIQGKALPFVNTDVVALGFRAVTAGTYTINLDHTDGLFAGEQDIFIKDNFNGTYHNIKNGDYTFTASEGTFANRFEVVYQSAPLGVGTPAFDDNSVVIFKQNGMLNISTGAATMETVKIFDIRGRLLFEKNNINGTTFVVNQFKAEQQVLIVQITSDDNKTVSKKVAY
ncbi:YDG domain-containing protein [Flavobacterium sp.]|uniref:YDG domain-containing protein n=1 Tax=Flavobacterium sp. TaxID=239 RepID=UPI002627B4FA|nr:YDG domain-containing protein [Flavobacterium sp.]